MKTPRIRGYHWQYDGWNIAPELLGDSVELLLFCKRLMALLHMTPLGRASVHVVDGHGTQWGAGVTILLPITDSHIAVQTLPQAGQVFLDVFSCKPLERAQLRQDVQAFFMGRGKDRLIKRG